MTTPSSYVYVECDLPADMTLAEWRRARASVRTRRSVRIARRIRRRGATG
jgi:hypothetical protein